MLQPPSHPGFVKQIPGSHTEYSWLILWEPGIPLRFSSGDSLFDSLFGKRTTSDLCWATSKYAHI